MRHDQNDHHRRSIRLKEYDYSQEGAYFITVCVKNRECLFDKYSSLKNIVQTQWEKIPNQFANVELDEYIIMPNHLHGILSVGATLAVARNATLAVARNATLAVARNATLAVAPGIDTIVAKTKRAGARPAPTIGDVVGGFKSLCVVEWLRYMRKNKINETGKFWQRNYYEHIIRNEYELNIIREYIINNPLQWEMDNENPTKHKM